jgi:hypothetical protein
VTDALNRSVHHPCDNRVTMRREERAAPKDAPSEPNVGEPQTICRLSRITSTMSSPGHVAKGWTGARRVVAKVEWHQGELCPRVGFIVTNLTRPNAGVVKFYNGRGTAEQWIKEGKNVLRWARLSCHAFRHNAVRLQLHALAYNLANFLRTLTLPQEVEHWLLTTLREKLVRSAPGSCAMVAMSCFSWPRWRCRAPCPPRSCAGSTGSGQNRRRSQHEPGEQ